MPLEKAREWLNSLAEQDQENEDLIANIYTLNQALEVDHSETDVLRTENEQLKTQLSESRKKFYQTFQNGGLDPIIPTDEESQETEPQIIGLNQLISELEKGN